MTELTYGACFLVLFSLSALGGMALRAGLPKEHLSSENMDTVRLVTGLLVTFAALVLSLQLSAARSALDAAIRDRTVYAARLESLHRCLGNLGPALEPARLRLRQYTATVIASTWPHELAPRIEGMPSAARMPLRGEEPSLAGLINAIGVAVDSFTPADPAAANLAARCRGEFSGLADARAAVIEDPYGPSGESFVIVVSIWLSLVFLSLGLQMPHRMLSAVVLAIGVLAVSSVMFVIVDLIMPYRGMFGVPSAAMRHALTDMMR